MDGSRVSCIVLGTGGWQKRSLSQSGGLWKITRRQAGGEDKPNYTWNNYTFFLSSHLLLSTVWRLFFLFFFFKGWKLRKSISIVLEREINKTISLFSAENSNFLSYLTDQSGPSISFSPIHFNQKVMFDRIVYVRDIKVYYRGRPAIRM